MELQGSGLPLIMLHGWGMHAGIFSPLSGQLARNSQVVKIDLPGHGESDEFEHFADLDQLAGYLVTQLLPLLERGAILLGWSMGGVIAQMIAIMYPKYVRKLVLICSTPCFAQRVDWHHAVMPEMLNNFAAELQRDAVSTLSRFLSLQFVGMSDHKEHLREAKKILSARPGSGRSTLEQGLSLLLQCDLRRRLSSLHSPTLVINAEHDKLVPAAAGCYLAERVVNGRCVIIKGAGHAPFLSHSATVMFFLNRFLYEY